MKQCTEELPQPDIFGYYNYREFLRDLVAFKRSTSRAFSHRYIVQKAGFKSPTALKHVIDGKRNLSLEAANQFACALKIEGIARSYFLTMVLFNQSTSLSEQEKYLSELIELKQAEDPSRIDEEQFSVLSDWYHLAIREMTALPDFVSNPRWIAKALTPPVTVQQAADSLRMLEKCGLLVRKNGSLHPADRTIATDPQVHSVKLAEFHRNMIARGSEAIASFARDEREISGTTLRVSKADVMHIKMLLREFRKKLLTLAANSSEADQVYQFNVQFFPLVHPDRTHRAELLKENS